MAENPSEGPSLPSLTKIVHKSPIHVVLSATCDKRSTIYYHIAKTNTFKRELEILKLFIKNPDLYFQEKGTFHEKLAGEKEWFDYESIITPNAEISINLFGLSANSKYVAALWCFDLSGRIKELKHEFSTKNNGG